MQAHKGEWMESGEDPLLSPTIFLAEQPPRSTVPSHFHRQNQFQLFVDGSGTIGTSKLDVLTVHYAGAYTGYGPLVAGADGLKYFTIRPAFDSGAIGLEEAREKMVRGPKRHATAGPIKVTPLDDLSVLSAPVSLDAIPFSADGLGARILRLPPHAAAQVVDTPPTPHTVFMVVLAGSAVHDAGELTRWESAFSTSYEDLPRFSAGPQGAEVIFLFTPAKAQAYL
jgi:hypothetical protein